MRARNVRVLGNADKLAQVFINLISNAIKHNADTAPLVRVTSAVRDGVYEVRIADNGPGIPPQERELIFIKFERGRYAGRSGAGLGLPISRQIVERFGGSLELAEDCKVGAEFVVRLRPVEASRARDVGEDAPPAAAK